MGLWCIVPVAPGAAGLNVVWIAPSWCFPTMLSKPLLVFRNAFHSLLETRFALHATAWKSRSLTCLGNPSGNYVLFLSHVASVGRRMCGRASCSDPVREKLDHAPWQDIPATLSSGPPVAHSQSQLGWRKPSAGVAVVVDFVQSFCLVLVSCRVLCLEELPTALCLMKRLTQLLRGSVINAWTPWCATMMTQR